MRIPPTALAWLAALTFGACDGSAGWSVELPACGGLGAFGNGARCVGESGEIELDRCGDPAAVACSEGRICFDTPGKLACTCDADGDCAGFVDYVNQARAAVGQATLEPRCDVGRCLADVDPAP
jgi:hypothetical protein